MARHNKAKARRQSQKAMSVKNRTAPGQQHLTMQQEAMNTEGRNTWRTGSDFRHKAVQFVSAGLQGDRLDAPSKDARCQDSILNQDSQENEEGIRQPVHQNPKTLTCQSRGHTTQIEHANPESTSEDEIVFPGRHARAKRVQPSQHHIGPETVLGDDILNASDLTEVEETAGFDWQANASRGSRRHTRPSGKAQSSIMHEDDFISIETNGLFLENRRSRHSQDEEDDVLADYIANIDDEYENSYCEPDAHQDSSSEAGGNQDSRRNSIVSAGSGESEYSEMQMTHEDIHWSSSGDVPPECGHKEHSSVGECLPDFTHSMTPNRMLKGIDHMHERECVSHTPTSVSRNSSHVVGLTTSSASETNEIEESTRHTGADTHSQLKPERQASRLSYPYRNRGKPEAHHIASATAFADALETDPFYGFDIMDFNRPSLRKKKKGKQPDFGLLLSDSELELELEQAWQNDREKKKTRKQRREELRAQGLLSRGPEMPNLKIRYSDGIDINELRLETRKFLLSSKDSLALPPMAKQHRKFVHDMANALSLKSHSRGNGSSRFPVLYRTSRTPSYTQRTIIQVDKTLSSAKFNRRASKLGEGSSGRSAKSRRGRPESSVSYMDGDVVGASAPAIGAGNKGRAMLEKMGWSSGTPLGALNNKGILLPVAHVVKNSKAGLG